MFAAEARRVYEVLTKQVGGPLSPILDIGSSTARLREIDKPWIEDLLFRPLRGRGEQVVHVDVKNKAGVDLIADLLTEEGFERLRAERPRTILLCNVLEHVLDPGLLMRRALELLEPGGWLLVSVPRSYPYHRDPIDTLFRPTPAEVAALAPEASLVHGEVIDTGSYWNDVRMRPWILLRQILRAPFPFLGYARYKRTMKKLYWLVRPYQVSVVLMRKQG